jgi:hypothetical protein
MGRTLILIGLTVAALGVVMWMVERTRLPGDFVWRGKNTTVYFPLASSLVASLLLTGLLWLFRRR